MSFIESYLARADRSASEIIKEVFETGSKFDGWSAKFNFKNWQQAFDKLGIDQEKIVNKNWDQEAVFPWEHIDCGFNKDRLKQLYSKVNQHN